MTVQECIIKAIQVERQRQDKLFGGLPHNQPLIWIFIAAEELGEIAEEIEAVGDEDLIELLGLIKKTGDIARHYLEGLKTKSFKRTTSKPIAENYQTELIQLAAVCVAALEDEYNSETADAPSVANASDAENVGGQG